SRIRGQFNHSGRRRFRISRLVSWSVAAVAILTLGYYFVPSWNVAEEQRGHAHVEVVPGGQRAHVLLADGRKIHLDSLEEGQSVVLDGYSIHKDRNGKIIYASLDGSDSPIYNNIVTPIGGEYNVVLADGTEVYLNAASNLRYPIRFAKENREVELLEGEAYFEVNKVKEAGERVPFQVKSKGQVITVLGTAFNVNSYNKSIVTTLVEGSVKLNSKQAEKYLKPAQQATLRPGSEDFAVMSVDPSYAVAWKSGLFAYENASIHQVMTDISRWYDIDIQFENIRNDSRFSGRLSRFENIDKLLNTISLTGSVNFKREGRRVFVMK
ncbi:MAG: FecR domain-containing protein, partial [Sphingobacterium sp.]|nr:FecR domain-containing protein [Sphingobacterium sp.]